MTPERIEQERMAFEAWMVELYPTNPQTERVGDEYSRLGTQYKWEGWQAKAAQPEWISVEDRLPEIGTRVLLCGRYEGKGIIAYCAIGYFDGKTYREHWGADINATAAITHWQPLPAPPEGD